MSLRSRSLSGLAWTFSERFSMQAISFIISIFLARLLLPEEFGLIGMIMVFLAIGTSLRDSGMTSSLIRTQDAEESDYSTVFYINLIASLIIYTLLYFLTPLIATFFESPILTNIVRVLSLKIPIEAFSSIQNTRLTKVMDFKKQMTIQIPSVIVGGLSGIAFAYLGFGVWSLVYMNLIQSLLATLQLWIRTDWKPKLILSLPKLIKHFSFGYKLTLAGLLDTLYQNMYHIIIGKYFSAAQLGFYVRAQSTKQLPVSNVSAALNKVTYPLLAEIQDDNIRMKSVYKRLMQQVLFWIAPVLTGAGVLAEPLFRFLFTEKWLPAVPFFQMLCIVGIMYPLHGYNLSILNVKGRSDLYLKLQLIKKAYTVTVVLLIIPFGIYALVGFQVVSTFISFFINSYFSGKLINYKVSEQISDIAPIFALSIAMGLVCMGGDCLLVQYANYDIIRLVGVGILGASFYLGLAYLMQMSPFLEFNKIVFRK